MSAVQQQDLEDPQQGRNLANSCFEKRHEKVSENRCCSWTVLHNYSRINAVVPNFSCQIWPCVYVGLVSVYKCNGGKHQWLTLLTLVYVDEDRLFVLRRRRRKWKTGSCQESNPEPLTWGASALTTELQPPGNHQSSQSSPYIASGTECFSFNTDSHSVCTAELHLGLTRKFSLSMGSFLMERIFWSTLTRVLTIGQGSLGSIPSCCQLFIFFSFISKLSSFFS